ncbi:MAG: AtpZ/AtpI family protein [Acidimicrobiales bacterium]
MDLQERRELNNGFGDSLARAVELVITPLIFGGLGYLLDHRLHTAPLFMLVFGLWTFSYVVWRLMNGYGRAMAEQERRLGVDRSRKDGHG